MPPSTEPRTNSLAFAKTDCHTCTANQRRCDRKRPRCASCAGKKIVCGGYPMQLTWPQSKPTQAKASVLSEQTDDLFHLEPLSLHAAVHVRNNRSRPRKPRKFRFVAERASGRKPISAEPSEARRKQISTDPSATQARASIQRSNTPGDRSRYQYMPISPLPGTLESSVHAASPSISNEQCNVSDLLALSPVVDFSEPLDWSSWSSTGTIDVENLDTFGELDSDCNTAVTSSSIDNAAGRPSLPTSILKDPRQNIISFGSPVLHKSLFGKFEVLLNMYDQDFCVVPLSGDVPSNPFRCRSETSRGSQSLLHAILAVSCYHAGRQASKGDYPPSDVFDHQNTAIQLYRNELNTYTGSQAVQLLDTTMVLFLFHATQSAFGSWATRISDAQKLLRLSGGPEIWVHNRRVQAQVVLLLWDATIALLSRQACLLPYSYFEALLALEDDRYWSFFDLIGCPRELLVPLMQLARLAEENEKASSMHWTTFDLTLVDEIQASIINWKNPSLEIEDDFSEEEMQQQRDRWNCSEAWSASSVLEEVWMEQAGPRGDAAWWGSVIDRKQKPYQSHIAPMQFCFG
ncbi:hypothetical protein BP6252_13592 [Coleophoma cylindrospora]|uniref:Zn(2)-C6 fungal-type domain-containing protein n=1 Tax=Coleophoma cylindrospora TaxID=1849047 RepID=A0A3D8Q8Q9_9HELO|nr:hypothetical protein BP6252_13592 [Coleophoma cylindrospora]